VAHYVTRLGARADFHSQNALEFLLELSVMNVNVERFLTRSTLAQGSQPVSRQNDNMFVRLTGRAFIAVFGDVPAELLDYIRKQQDLSGERTSEIIFVGDRVCHAKYMEIVAHVSNGFAWEG
jgi:hypothetical protein